MSPLGDIGQARCNLISSPIRSFPNVSVRTQRRIAHGRVTAPIGARIAEVKAASGPRQGGLEASGDMGLFRLRYATVRRLRRNPCQRALGADNQGTRFVSDKEEVMHRSHLVLGIMLASALLVTGCGGTVRMSSSKACAAHGGTYNAAAKTCTTTANTKSAAQICQAGGGYYDIGADICEYGRD